MSAINWTKRKSQNVVSVGDTGTSKCDGRELVVIAVNPERYRWV